MEPLYVSPITGAEYDYLYTLEFTPGGFASFKSYDEVQAFRAEHKITGTLYTPDGYMVDELWWCNSHQRRATFLRNGKHACDPKLGGIMIPCFTVNLTGQAELIEES